MNDTNPTRVPAPRLDPNADPITHAAQVREMKRWATAELKRADDDAVREGQRQGLDATTIGARIGASAAHVYSVLARIRAADEQQQ